MTTQRTKAVRAFAALCALDADAAARTELAAAGVSAHQIAALYPGGGFEALVPHLIARTKRLPTERFESSHAPTRRQLATVSNLLRADAGDAAWAQHAAWYLADERAAEADSLRSAIELRLKPNGYLTYQHVVVRARLLSDACWWAWLLMQHRAELTWLERRCVDFFTLQVARMLELV